MTIQTLLASLVGMLIAALAWYSSISIAAEVPKFPRHGKSLSTFVPVGYEVGIEVNSDFNGDDRQDIAALFWVTPDSAEIRPFIIILQQQDGNYRLSDRADYFTLKNGNSCGAGNFNCVPNINAKGQKLVISMPWGSAAGYVIYEKEFRLIDSDWYQVRQASYGRGSNLTCPLTKQKSKKYRCIEQGVSINIEKAVETKYCKFADDNGDQTSVLKYERKIAVEPLKKLREVKWEESTE